MKSIRKIFGIISLVLCTIVSFGQIVINEVQYTNRTTIFDTDGDTPDWIELYNAGANPINLQNYRLTDDQSGNEYWEMPAITIGAHQYIIVYASGKDKRNQTEMHTNFKLRVIEDGVYLFDPQGRLLQTVKPQCVPADKSLGRYPTPSDEFSVLSPSPGKSNANASVLDIEYQTDSLMVNYASGFYTDSIDVILSNTHPSNTIKYTLDCDVPNDRSQTYGGAIVLHDISSQKNRFANKGDAQYDPGNLLSKANVLRAQVFSAGCPASEEVIHTYFIGTNHKFQYSVPIVSLVTDKDNLFDADAGIAVAGNHTNYAQHGKAWERPVKVQMFDSSGATLIDQNAGMRIHGRGSRAGDQKSFRLYARSKYGAGVFSHPLFSQKPELSQFKTLLLRTTNGWSGIGFKDELCHRLVQDMNIDYVATETAIVFLNGEYWGIYSLRERQDEHYVAHNYGIENPEIDVIAHDLNNGLLVENGDGTAYSELERYVENTDPLSDNFLDGLSSLLDVDAFIDYYIAQLYLANTDFPNNNVEMWRLQNDTARWRPFFFDLDGAMIRTNFDILAEYNQSDNVSHTFPDYSTLILRKCLQNPTFNRLFNSRFIFALNTYFAPERVLKLINEYEALYTPLMGEHIYRWGTPIDKTKWKHNVDMIRGFAIERPAVMNEQLIQNLGTPIYVYPNPSEGTIWVDVPTSIAGKLTIYNSQGRQVLSADLGDSDLNSFQHMLTSGVYTIQMQFAGNIFTEQLIVR